MTYDKNENKNGRNFLSSNYINICFIFAWFILSVYFSSNIESQPLETFRGEDSINITAGGFSVGANDIISGDRQATGSKEQVIRSSTTNRIGEGEVIEYNSGRWVINGSRVQNIQEPTQWKQSIIITSYNPTNTQTDSTPCISSIGINICNRNNVIALSQDLIKGTRGAYCRENCFAKYGDKVRIESDNKQCEGEYTVLDTMNKRWTNRADLFYIDKSFNTLCTGLIYNITKDNESN